jgi:Flp pilus assembly protein TadB
VPPAQDYREEVSRLHLPGRHRTEPEAVYRVTDARRPHSDDQHSRVVKYLVSMGIRIVCLFLALVTPSPWRWVFIAGAIVLPYVAVVIANAGVEQRPRPFERAEDPLPPQLTTRRPDEDDEDPRH